MTDTITIKELATKAGMEARGLRRLLRDKFPRTTKGKAYEWEANDPQVDLILKAATERKIRKVNYDASELKTVKPATMQRVTTKPVKKQTKTMKPNTTKKVAKTDSVQEGGEANGDSAASA